MGPETGILENETANTIEESKENESSSSLGKKSSVVLGGYRSSAKKEEPAPETKEEPAPEKKEEPAAEKKEESVEEKPKAPVTRLRRNAITERQFMAQISGGVTDSDKSVLKEPGYYEKKIEEVRGYIDGIHELRALLKSFPSSEKINEEVLKSAKGKNGQSYVNGYMDKWNEFVEKYPFISGWYEGVVEENIDNSIVSDFYNIYGNNVIEIMALHGVVDMSNQAKILPFRASVYEKLERYKQDRDMAHFVKQSGINNTNGVDLQNKTIYSFKLGNTIVYGYLDADNNFQTFKNKEDFVNNAVDKNNNSFGWTKKKAKADFDKAYDEEVEKIKAMKELESKLDSSGLMDKINLSTITAYMNFDESSFEKQAAQYRLSKSMSGASQIEKPSAQTSEGEYEGEKKGGIPSVVKDSALSIAEQAPGALVTGLEEIDGKYVENASILLKNIKNNLSWEDKGENLKLIDDGKEIIVPKADVFKGLCINGGISLAKLPLEVLGIIKNCTEVPSMLEDLAHAGKIGNGGFFSDEVEKILETSKFITSDIIAKSMKAALSTIESVSKIVTGAGAMSAGALSNVLSVTGSISAGIGIGTGVLSVGKGAYDAAKATHEVHQAKKADNELGQYGTRRTAKNSRFLHQVEINSRQKRAGAILDMATGAVDIASGVMSMIPLTQAAGTVLSMANMALKLIGKFAISKYFKGKKKDQAWADILQFSDVDEYNKFSDKVGSENFHNVLRRKTGVSTRQAYADALNITDAIDIYTMAKLHSGKADTNDTDEKISQATLSGVGYSDPSKYKELKLSDILGKVGASSDWKGTLKSSITDKKGVFSGKTREQKEDIG